MSLPEFKRLGSEIAALPTDAGSKSAPAVRSSRADALPHMPQLDAVRAFAALGVMACHYLPYRIALEGGRGVTLFFVLSGFLITGILLQCRGYIEQEGQPRFLTLRQFYIRRFLRIFPLYYFVLAALWLIHDPGVRGGAAWHLSYLTNFLIVHRGGIFPDWSVAPFWSLAVEEQFYLIWPWLVLFVPRRALVWVVCALVCVAPTFRLVGGLLRITPYVLYPMPFFWLDALGLGALLAIASEPSFELRWILKVVRIAALPVGAVAIAGGIWLAQIHRFPTIENAIYYSGYAVAGAWLVAWAARGFTGIAGRVMTFKPLLWIGVISYGIYVYHIIVVTYWDKLSAGHLGAVSRAAASAAITFAIAALSFYLYEHPINQLKRYFPYRARGPLSESMSGDMVPTTRGEKVADLPS